MSRSPTADRVTARGGTARSDALHDRLRRATADLTEPALVSVVASANTATRGGPRPQRTLDGRRRGGGREVREVRWVGDPHEPVSSADGRLRPRASFDLWREEVRGHSAPWTADDVAAAEELWRSLTGAIVGHTRRLQDSNRELERSNAELDAFAFTASHDLKAPLYSIASDAAMLREDHGDRLDATGRQRLTAIERGATRMTAQVEAVLEFGRVGHADLAVAPVALASVVDDVRDALRIQIAERGATVWRDDALPVVHGDRVLLGQLFDNLLANALTYTGARRPAVHIDGPGAHERAALPPTVPGAVVVVVRDNGVGVAAEHRDDIFAVFRRLPSSRSFGSGSGIGLATARRIAERHGGTIVVTDADGGGAAFCVVLAEGG